MPKVSGNILRRPWRSLKRQASDKTLRQLEEKDADYIARLKRSMLAKGILRPFVIKPDGTIVDGNTRYDIIADDPDAFPDDVPCFELADIKDEVEELTVGYHANQLHRKHGWEDTGRLVFEMLKTGKSVSTIAADLGCSEGEASKAKTVLLRASKPVLQALRDKRISPSHAYLIATSTDQAKLLELALGGMSAKDLDEERKHLAAGREAAAPQSLKFKLGRCTVTVSGKGTALDKIATLEAFAKKLRTEELHQ